MLRTWQHVQAQHAHCNTKIPTQSSNFKLEHLSFRLHLANRQLQLVGQVLEDLQGDQELSCPAMAHSLAAPAGSLPHRHGSYCLHKLTSYLGSQDACQLHGR